MTDTTRLRWVGIEAGDVGFDQGGGVVGFLIRHFSHSPYAHCWVYDAPIYERGHVVAWHTIEAYPGGLKKRVRDIDRVDRVARLWRDEDERLQMLATSGALLGSRYNYRELFRIIHYRARKIWLYLFVLWAVFFLLFVFTDSMASFVFAVIFSIAALYAAIPLRTKKSEGAVICSNHVAQCVLSARSDVRLSFPPQMIWPGRLERDLNLVTWHDWLEEQRDHQVGA